MQRPRSLRDDFHTICNYVRNPHRALDSITGVTYISYGRHKVWRRLIRRKADRGNRTGVSLAAVASRVTLLPEPVS